ncbi:CAP domain-containing protein [Paenibacillus beijingensis]|uniref:SCP domain-containing protein n=1 Tax=Paenibacillus beijingensis TaxID=1126833 RepID=A0A0D5NL52_9BACL|nr:CAP domain-containing protein [Paenibacillus beijingensis]AJY75722.1 hypothetical protein VN24_15645 [Paenibacillus beijingensis]
MNKQPIRKGIATAVIAGMTLVGAGANAQSADAAALDTNFAATVNIPNCKTVMQQQYNIDFDSLLKQIPDLQKFLNEAGTAAPNKETGTPNHTGTPNTVKKPAVNKPAVNKQPAANPTPAKDSKAGTSADSSKSSFAAEVVTLVNQERAKQGLNALKSDALLDKVALAKAKDMYDNNYFDHNSPTYGSPFDMMRQFGVKFSYAGENIAKGQRSPQEVMNGWMNSPGHRANILSTNFNKIGVAYYNGEWVQEFTS